MLTNIPARSGALHFSSRNSRPAALALFAVLAAILSACVPNNCTAYKVEPDKSSTPRPSQTPTSDSHTD